MFPLIVVIGVLLNVFYFGKAIQYTEIILTTSGSLRGEEVDMGKIRYKSFKGIPYAAPPTGEHRFKEPQPPEIWEDIKNFVEFGYICHQGFRSYLEDQEEIKTRMGNQSEDCLTLNIYTKKLGVDAAQAVLFYIHGDGFYAGDGSDSNYGPEFLVEQDLVVVTFNYRLGPLGFLATGTEDAPGNWGLKDQVAALKWVHENIAEFGGDSNKITLYGHGAGAASAHFHMMSPLSRGLFDKVILSSGTANCIWALTYDQERYSENLAKYLGASENQAEDPEKRVEFLRGVDARNLSISMWMALEAEDFKNNLGLPVPFLPVLEPPETTDYFMIDDPNEALVDGNFAKVPTVIGFNSNEGGIQMIMPQLKSPKTIKILDEDLCLVLPQYLRERIKEKEQDCANVSEEIRKVYFGGKSIEGRKENLTNLISDSLFVNEIVYAENLHAKHSKEGHFVYGYYFNYVGEWNMVKRILEEVSPDMPGALHGDDISYVFNPRIVKLPLRAPSKPGLDTKARMTSFISNFVKTGNPTPAVSDLIPLLWEPVQENQLNTMVITGDIKMEQEVLKERMELWESIYNKYDPLTKSQ